MDSTDSVGKVSKKKDSDSDSIKVTRIKKTHPNDSIESFSATGTHSQHSEKQPLVINLESSSTATTTPSKNSKQIVNLESHTNESLIDNDGTIDTVEINFDENVLAELNAEMFDETLEASRPDQLDDFIDFNRLELMPPYLPNKSHFQPPKTIYMEELPILSSYFSILSLSNFVDLD